MHRVAAGVCCIATVGKPFILSIAPGYDELSAVRTARTVCSGKAGEARAED